MHATAANLSQISYLLPVLPTSRSPTTSPVSSATTTVMLSGPPRALALTLIDKPTIGRHFLRLNQLGNLHGLRHYRPSVEQEIILGPQQIAGQVRRDPWGIGQTLRCGWARGLLLSDRLAHHFSNQRVISG